ncbi:MAG: hypothetical protein RLZZ361_90 [Cyanobacteriota bacterium]|jgi:hypothetical protein
MSILNELLDKLEISVKSDTESILHGQKVNHHMQKSNYFTSNKINSERNPDEEVFFNTVLNQPPQLPPNNHPQISIKKSNYLPTYSNNPTLDSKAIKNLIAFFVNEPCINIYNFNHAEKLLARFINLKNITDIEELKHKLSNLQEEFDKHTSSHDKFGKLLLNWSLRVKGIKLTITRPKLAGFKQLIAINFNQDIEISILSYWTGKQNKHEFIKSRSQNRIHKKNHRSSIAFDAEVWRSFNFAGISFKNYFKTLECLERNRNTLPDLIQEINRKSLIKVIHENYLNNVTIKSDNHETAYLSFVTNRSQKVDIKICSYASSIVVG